jgi:hypothetical protein
MVLEHLVKRQELHLLINSEKLLLNSQVLVAMKNLLILGYMEIPIIIKRWMVLKLVKNDFSC